MQSDHLGLGGAATTMPRVAAALIATVLLFVSPHAVDRRLTVRSTGVRASGPV